MTAAPDVGRQAPGQVFMPMHYREAAANLLTNPQLDPYARIASFKISAVRIQQAGVSAKPLEAVAGKSVNSEK